MTREAVLQLSPVERFLYWCAERHQIYLRRQRGEPKPWTDDPILQSVYFTNVYRELDKTSVWFRETIRDPLRHDPIVVFATACFRWFNYIPTGEILVASGWHVTWDEDSVLVALRARRSAGHQIFTGAYMINSPPGKAKLEAICERVSNVWNDRHALLQKAVTWKTMEQAHQDLLVYPGLGGFMAYEIVCDLRYTALLDHASDKLTWSNPGPGAIRGLYRVLGRPIPNKSNATAPPKPSDWTEQTQRLLARLQDRFPEMPPFEAREVEMALCEVDKYNRVLAGDGKAKRSYNGGAQLL